MVKNKDKQIIPGYNDPHSPYSSDHPGCIISPVSLNSDNYNSWARLAINALKSRNKLSFVDGKLPKPPSTNSEVHAWEKCGSMAITWLFNVIDKSLHASVAYANTSNQIWTDLEERYLQASAIKVHQLKRKMSLVGQEHLSVMEYFTKLESLWDELESYHTLPKCKCECKYGKAMAAKIEEEKVHQFLMGLDHKKYNTVRSNILS